MKGKVRVESSSAVSDADVERLTVVINDDGYCLQCVLCCELRQELVQLSEASEARARDDHDQCVTMFQQMQELVAMNESLTYGCNQRGRRSVNENVKHIDNDEDLRSVKETVTEGRSVATNVQMQIRRLQAIVIQQAKELETLRKKQRDTQVDGRVRSTVKICLARQLEDNERTEDFDEEDDDIGGGDEDRHSEFQSSKHADQLMKLPLTSLHAQLKGKDLQLKRLEEVIAKHETRFGLLVDKKRSLVQNFQQTTRSQQTQLKRYLSYIRQQTVEKKALERQVSELNQYIAVLEKKVVDCSLRFSRKRNGSNNELQDSI